MLHDIYDPKNMLDVHNQERAARGEAPVTELPKRGPHTPLVNGHARDGRIRVSPGTQPVRTTLPDRAPSPPPMSDHAAHQIEHATISPRTAEAQKPKPKAVHGDWRDKLASVMRK
jgi:hypothetical protein